MASNREKSAESAPAPSNMTSGRRKESSDLTSQESMDHLWIPRLLFMIERSAAKSHLKGRFKGTFPTQIEIAKLMGVTDRAILPYFKGYKPVPLDFIEKVSNLIGVRPELFEMFAVSESEFRQIELARLKKSEFSHGDEPGNDLEKQFKEADAKRKEIITRFRGILELPDSWSRSVGASTFGNTLSKSQKWNDLVESSCSESGADITDWISLTIHASGRIAKRGAVSADMQAQFEEGDLDRQFIIGETFSLSVTRPPGWYVILLESAVNPYYESKWVLMNKWKTARKDEDRHYVLTGKMAEPSGFFRIAACVVHEIPDWLRQFTGAPGTECAPDILEQLAEWVASNPKKSCVLSLSYALCRVD